MLALNLAVLVLMSSTLMYNGRQACDDQRSIRGDGFAEKYTDLDEFDANYAGPKRALKRLNFSTALLLDSYMLERGLDLIYK